MYSAGMVQSKSLATASTGRNKMPRRHYETAHSPWTSAPAAAAAPAMALPETAAALVGATRWWRSQWYGSFGSLALHQLHRLTAAIDRVRVGRSNSLGARHVLGQAEAGQAVHLAAEPARAAHSANYRATQHARAGITRPETTNYAVSRRRCRGGEVTGGEHTTRSSGCGSGSTWLLL